MAQTDINVTVNTRNIGEDIAKAQKGIENVTGLTKFNGFNVKQDVVGMADEETVNGYIKYIDRKSVV